MAEKRRREKLESRPLFDEAAERAIVGACLHDPSVFWSAHGRLKPEHFAITRLGRIWDAMQRVSSASKPLKQNYIALFMNNDSGEDTPIKILLAALFNDAPAPSEADPYIETVVHLANKRSLLESLDLARAEIMSMDVGVPAEQMKDVGIRKITAAFSGDRDDDMMDYHEWGTKVFYRSIKSLQDGESGGFGYSSGLKAVDETIGHILPGKSYVLAGMSGAGKSALAQQIIEQISLQAAARKLGKAYIGSLEMMGDEYASRHIARELGLISDKIEQGHINPAELEAMGRKVDEMKRFPIIVDSRPRQNIEHLRARALKIKNTFGLSAFAVDHILLVKASGKMDSLAERIAEVTIECKNIAKEFNVPAIILAQIDEKRLFDSTIKWPNSTMLFGGQAITQNADVVMFVHRPEIVLAKNEPPQDKRGKNDDAKTPWQVWNESMEKVRGKAYVYNNKRRGGAGNVRRELLFSGERMTFSDI